MRDIKTREGFEFWDKLNALPRYSFFLSPSGTSVQKFEDKALGNWIDVHEAQKVVDQAQERISELQDRKNSIVVLMQERDALQLRLNVADQLVDELTAKPSDAERERLRAIIENYPNGDPLEYNAAVRAIRNNAQ